MILRGGGVEEGGGTDDDGLQMGLGSRGVEEGGEEIPERLAEGIGGGGVVVERASGGLLEDIAGERGEATAGMGATPIDPEDQGTTGGRRGAHGAG